MAAFTLWRTGKVARGKDRFRPSIRVLFGDAAQAGFPLGRFILHRDDRAPDVEASKLDPRTPMKSLPAINPHAAAIDVGSETLHLSIGGDAPVVFGTVTDEVHRPRDYLQAQGVTTVAMEATGMSRPNSNPSPPRPRGRSISLILTGRGSWAWRMSASASLTIRESRPTPWISAICVDSDLDLGGLCLPWSRFSLQKRSNDPFPMSKDILRILLMVSELRSKSRATDCLGMGSASSGVRYEAVECASTKSAW